MAGDRAGSGGGGLDAQDVLDTASAEESVVVPNVVQGDTTTYVDGSLVLSASLDPQFGGLQWNPNREERAKFQEAISTSQMASMLKDQQRNAKYDAALRSAVAEFRETHGRAPVVLDIGCGTGLLSLMAARAGAKQVYACEMFDSLAEIAQKTVDENITMHVTQNVYKEPICDIRVFGKKSTDLVVAQSDKNDTAESDDYDIPGRCDMLVSEILDSALIGESVLPVIRHARRELLIPNAVVIPSSATVYGQIINSPCLRNLFDTRHTSVTVPLQGSKESLHVPLSRRDWFESMEADESEACPVSMLVPVQMDAAQNQLKLLSTEFVCFKVDLTNGTILTKEGKAVENNSLKIEAPVTADGVADVLGIWWDLCLVDSLRLEDGIDSRVLHDPKPNVYSTRPRFLSSSEDASVDGRFKRRKSESLWPWQDHWVQCIYPLVDNTHKVTADTTRLLDCIVSDVRMHFKVVRESTASDAGETMLEEGNQCVCGVHELNNIERVSMLNSAYYTGTLAKMISKNLDVWTNRATGDRGPLIDLSDGSLAALIASAYCSKLENSKKDDIVSLEEKEMSQMVWTQLARMLAFTIESDNLLENFLIAENLTEVVEMFEDDGDEAEKHTKKSVILCGEPYFYQMCNQQLWVALNYWYRTSAVARSISHSCMVFPCRAFVRAMAVDMQQLWDSHGTVDAVCGFCHSEFNKILKGWWTKQFHYPLWQYDFVPLSAVTTLVEFDYQRQPFTERNSYFESFHSIKIDEGRTNGIMLWVDFDLSVRNHNKSGDDDNANVRKIDEQIPQYDAYALGQEGIVSGAPRARPADMNCQHTDPLTWTKQTLIFLEKPVDSTTANLNLKVTLDHASGQGLQITFPQT